MNKPKILYVDDEVVNLMLFEANFGKKYTVLTATDGLSGLSTLSENDDVHLVFSDMRMPRMNGIEFIAEASKLCRHCSFYIMTGYDVTDEIQEAIDKKLVSKYFRKPLNMNSISSEIEQSLKK